MIVLKNEKRKKESSLILRLAKFQAIFELNLSPRAGSGRGKYIFNLKRIGRCLEFFAFAKNRHDFSGFGCAKVLTLSLVFSLNLSTSFAACNFGDPSCNGTTEEDYAYGFDIKNAYCCYHIINETNGLINIEIYKDPAAGDNPAMVGNWAFNVTDAYYELADIGSVVIKEGITRIGGNAFSGQENLTSVILPDSMESLYGNSFEVPNNLSSIIIPDSVTSISRDSFYRKEGLNIICKGDETSCAAMVSALTSAGYSGTVSYANESQCTGNYGWTGKSCARKDENGNVVCASGYADYKNKCWAELPFSKKKWTPAEANEWLNNDNNTVTITFKK